jgi:anthranilate phosphoribosyltransferase
MNALQQSLHRLLEGESLNADESSRVMQIMLSGGATPAQIAAILVALRMKGETVAEITGAAQAMQLRAIPFLAPADAMDTCGTGGDNSGSYNVSTAVAIVLAACGVPVVKHGNRSVSSRSGSADVMTELGVKLQVAPEVMQEALATCNLAFLLAPAYHKDMRHIAPIRQELKTRTLFNLLGPLVNPATIRKQLLGVYQPSLVRPMAEVLQALGAVSAWVVCGAEGLDEISLVGKTHVAAVTQEGIQEFSITPEQAGLPYYPQDALRGGDAAINARALEHLLAGEASAYRDAVLLNTAAALQIHGDVAQLTEGVTLAAEAIDAGKARNVLDDLVTITNR